jgi:hypothetical protein
VGDFIIQKQFRKYLLKNTNTVLSVSFYGDSVCHVVRNEMFPDLFDCRGFVRTSLRVITTRSVCSFM